MTVDDGDGDVAPDEHRTFCRICNAMCGVVVRTEGDRVLEVRGDPEHALSRGYSCPKGRALPALHHSPQRLDRPEVGRGSARQAVGWDALLDDLTARITATVDEHGPDGVAMYLASGSAFDSAGRRAAERFLGALGSRQKYTATTIDTPCKPLVAELVGGWSGLTPVWDHERSRLLVLFGSNPIVSHGHSNAIPDPVNRLREHRSRGGRLWVVDPRRTETAAQADHHLQVRPGTDWLVLGWLVRRLLDDAEVRADAERRAAGIAELAAALVGFEDGLVSGATGLAAEDLAGLLAAVREAGRVSALTGTGTSMAATANVTEHLLWALHVVTDSYDRPGGMWFNPGLLSRLDTRQWEASSGAPGPGPPSRPELPHRFGEWPCAGLVSEIEAGHVGALIVVGGNPVTAFPDVARTRRALASLPTLAVLDVVATETTELATHVLPAVDQLERADATWLLDTYQLAVAGQFTEAVVAPTSERRPVWWSLGTVAEHLGFSALPRGLTVADATDEDLLEPLLARSAVGAEAMRGARSGIVASGAVFGWVHEKVLPDGRWRLAPEVLLGQLQEALAEARSHHAPGLVLVPHRQLRTMNSQLRDVAAPGGRTEVVLVMAHPSAATPIGPDGTGVTVTSPWGQLTGTLRADGRLHPDAVTVAHGWDDPNVSSLTSADEAVDPLTGMVLQSGVPVRLAASAPPRPPQP
ncbi:molybdopterin-containing oxidoreductase family protein [Rhabdothermincola salaria]|uniref:molybdopterin-containing oxidoreductase family protein n=1 Tax=Rhabdothermincola salaria TaxID=2903142 RepID=UPI001E2BA30D|nr:molybdopterin-dependent oxidoreductase [Rhabdothermincola salaria]MCD9625700.1 molybdopterin-dependent oxidoreductase [Rhabdothermincola salaria]